MGQLLEPPAEVWKTGDAAVAPRMSGAAAGMGRCAQPPAKDRAFPHAWWGASPNKVTTGQRVVGLLDFERVANPL